MKLLLIQACLTISLVIAWEYNSNEKLLSFSIEKHDLATDESENHPMLQAWSG
jgi:hypothetical protein